MFPGLWPYIHAIGEPSYSFALLIVTFGVFHAIGRFVLIVKKNYCFSRITYIICGIIGVSGAVMHCLAYNLKGYSSMLLSLSLLL
mmetsp:Transcript_6389/g.815  ORF Transcript_6389/g.815 Transcript_6389/m.815 type:complete len:85 (+) Transcript_6389:80-334(+)